MIKPASDIAKETLEIIAHGEYRNPMGETVLIADDIAKAVDGSVLIPGSQPLTEFADPSPSFETKVELTDETTLEACKRLANSEGAGPLFALNFANAVHPGGSFLAGAIAQEESLVRSSALYPTLVAHFEMYEKNHDNLSAYYSHDMIYSPSVPVFRNDDGSLLIQPYEASFITSPAVNAAILKQRGEYDAERVSRVSRERIRRILGTAREKGHETLVLGSWGCGVFENDPAMIAGLFDDELRNEFKGVFRRVVFAVFDVTLSRRVYKAFRDRFNHSSQLPHE